MFQEIDVNHDGNMSYAEFTSYLVELANVRYDKHHIGPFTLLFRSVLAASVDLTPLPPALPLCRQAAVHAVHERAQAHHQPGRTRIQVRSGVLPLAVFSLTHDVRRVLSLAGWLTGSYLKWFDGLDKYVVFEKAINTSKSAFVSLCLIRVSSSPMAQSSDRIKLFQPNLQTHQLLRGHKGQLLSGTVLLRTQLCRLAVAGV